MIYCIVRKQQGNVKLLSKKIFFSGCGCFNLKLCTFAVHFGRD